MKETGKKVLKGLWVFLNSKLFIFLVILGICFYIWQQINLIPSYDNEIIKRDQNIAALNDSIRIERNKSGDLTASISAFIATEKELKELNSSLYNALQAERGKVISLNQTIIKLIQDTTALQKYVDNLNTRIDNITRINDSTFVAPWRLVYYYNPTNFDLFDGQTFIEIGRIGDFLNLKHLDTKIIYRESQIELIWGQKIENDKLRVFVTSSHPALSVASLSGVLIDPNDSDYIKNLITKRKWFNGFSVGLGSTIGYDPLRGQYSLVFGPNISFNIYSW
jgi:hypothetical protein